MRVQGASADGSQESESQAAWHHRAGMHEGRLPGHGAQASRPALHLPHPAKHLPRPALTSRVMDTHKDVSATPADNLLFSVGYGSMQY